MLQALSNVGAFEPVQCFVDLPQGVLCTQTGEQLPAEEMRDEVLFLIEVLSLDYEQHKRGGLDQSYAIRS